MLLIKTSSVLLYWVMTSVRCNVAVPTTARRQNGTKMTSSDNVALSSERSNVKVRQCTGLVSSVEMCRGAVKYNSTGWPNLVGDNSLVDAETQLRTFTPLVQYGCARHHLTFFLCAVYLPMCTEKVPDVIGPCRSVCERARDPCEPLLHSFGFVWPAALNCSRFPVRNDHYHMCMEGPAMSVDDSDGDVRHRSSSTTHEVVVQFDSNTANVQVANSDASEERRSSATMTECLLTHNETACRAPCVWITTRQRVVSVWMVVTAIICLTSMLFCAVTYIIVDTRRFVYYERVVVLMGSCSAVCAVTLLLNVLLSPQTSLCRSDIDPIPASSHCVIVCVILYYYTLSSVSWWLVLNVVWLLTAGLRWSDGDVRRLTTWFHVVAWSVPAVLVVAVLVHKEVELDVVSGLCRVTRGTMSHVVLVITPLLVSLVLGVTLTVVTLVCSRLRLTKRRETNVQHVSKSSSEAPLSVRVGVVSMVSGTLLVCFTATIIYEFAAHRSLADDTVTVHIVSANRAAAVVRVICPLLIGVLTAPWMMSSQATASWRSLLRRQRGVRWQCCVVAVDGISITGRLPVTVTDTTGSCQQPAGQLLFDDVTDTAHCLRVTVPQRHHHHHHHLHQDHHHRHHHHQQHGSTCSQFCSVCHAHHHHRPQRCRH